MSQEFKLPLGLILLDGVGCILVLLAVLGALEFDIGLPALTTIWPVLAVIGVGLMVPMILWAVRLARSKA